MSDFGGIVLVKIIVVLLGLAASVADTSPHLTSNVGVVYATPSLGPIDERGSDSADIRCAKNMDRMNSDSNL